MDKVSCSVPGKAILFGEHAVVYPGHSAVIVPVTSVSCKVTVLLAKTFQYAKLSEYFAQAEADYRRFEESSDIDHLALYRQPENYIKFIVALSENFLKQRNAKLLPFRLEFASTIPQGGMGLSAAVAASATQAIMRYHGQTLSNDEWYALTLAAERFQHGRPSGADVAAVIYGQPICLNKNKQDKSDILPLKESTQLAAILKDCYLLHTGQPKQSTGEMVAFVREQYQRDPQLINSIEANTQKFLAAVSGSTLNEDNFKTMIDENGRALEALGVATKLGTELCEQIRQSGGAAKISGAGGLGSGACGTLLIYLTDKVLLQELANTYKLYPIV